MRYELTIEITDKNYIDNLIVALARQGYAPYLSYDGNVCVTVDSNDLIELK